MNLFKKKEEIPSDIKGLQKELRELRRRDEILRQGINLLAKRICALEFAQRTGTAGIKGMDPILAEADVFFKQMNSIFEGTK